jgi:hypothetical protein
MWKMAVGFAVFAALMLYALSKGGDIDMGGEKHGTDASHAPVAVPVATPVAAPAVTPAAVVAASVAVAGASAASAALPAASR